MIGHDSSLVSLGITYGEMGHMELSEGKAAMNQILSYNVHKLIILRQ